MEFGLQIGNLDWQRLKDVAREAEELGFDALFVPDHVVFETVEKQYDPHHLAYDAMVNVAVLIEATKRVRVGHLVLCNLFRHPVITAQSLASLDTLSGGRTYAGMGTGWTEREFRMTGIPYPDIATRLRMLDEALTCMRSLWANEQTSFRGEFYRLEEAILWPKPVQKPNPPILVGGGGRGLLRLAAKHADVVNIISDAGKPGYISLAQISKLTDDSFREKIRFLREETKKNGRDPKSIRVSNVIFSVVITDSEQATRAAAEGMAPIFGAPPELIVKSPMSLIGTPEQCTAELKRRIREWELSQVVFSNTDEKTMRRLAKEVLPGVK
jgi:probable F420-dependent oxidoreductase